MFMCSLLSFSRSSSLLRKAGLGPNIRSCMLVRSISRYFWSCTRGTSKLILGVHRSMYRALTGCSCRCGSRWLIQSETSQKKQFLIATRILNGFWTGGEWITNSSGVSDYGGITIQSVLQMVWCKAVQLMHELWRFSPPSRLWARMQCVYLPRNSCSRDSNALYRINISLAQFKLSVQQNYLIQFQENSRYSWKSVEPTLQKYILYSPILKCLPQ